MSLFRKFSQANQKIKKACLDFRVGTHFEWERFIIYFCGVGDWKKMSGMHETKICEKKL